MDRGQALTRGPLRPCVAVVHQTHRLALPEVAFPAEVALASRVLGIAAPALTLLGNLLLIAYIVVAQRAWVRRASMKGGLVLVHSLVRAGGPLCEVVLRGLHVIVGVRARPQELVVAERGVPDVDELLAVLGVLWDGAVLSVGDAVEVVEEAALAGSVSADRALPDKVVVVAG